MLLFVVTLLKFSYSFIKHKKFEFNTDFRLALFTLIVFYIQIVLGLFAYFTSDYFTGLKEGHWGEYMKSRPDRLIVIEHPVMMLLVLWLMHYGFKRMNRNINNRKKLLDILIFYGIGFLLVLLRIPWSKFI